MPSPFPGMDPDWEHPGLWPSFHSGMVNQIMGQLNRKLPSNYVASLEPRIEIGVVDVDEPIAICPDVAVTEGPQISQTRVIAATIAAPVEIPTVVRERMKVTAVHVRYTPVDRLVTVIEILSPINKRRSNPEHREYLNRRNTLLNTSTHLMEIDLLRKGERVEMSAPLPPAPYYVILSRASRRPICEVWPVQLGTPLPTVPVPLLKDDPDVALNLQQALADAYAQARYERRIDYNRPPAGPLTETETGWLRTLLAKREA